MLAARTKLKLTRGFPMIASSGLYSIILGSIDSRFVFKSSCSMKSMRLTLSGPVCSLVLWLEFLIWRPKPSPNGRIFVERLNPSAGEHDGPTMCPDFIDDWRSFFTEPLHELHIQSEHALRITSTKARHFSRPQIRLLKLLRILYVLL